MPTKKYKVNGRRVPGVTTIISTSLGWGKEGLLHWAWECGADGKDFREERDKAANAGTIAHALAEADIKGTLLPGPGPEDDPLLWEKGRNAYEGYLDWKERSRLKLVYSEISFIHPELRVGGTLDSVAEFDDELDVVDFKTSNHMHADHLIQVAAYRELYNEGIPFEWENGWEIEQFNKDPRPVKGIHILRFSKQGDFHHTHYAAPRMDKPFETFLLLRKLYDMKKEIEGML